MPDINVNALAEAINDKMDRDANNIESPKLPIFLIDVQYPTEENDYTWYRLYSDGWVEQGVGPRDLTSAVYTFTFPIPMQTSNYFVLTGINDALNTTAMTVKVTNRTTTSLQCRNSYQGSGSTLNGWVEVKGMAAGVNQESSSNASSSSESNSNNGSGGGTADPTNPGSGTTK